jgi:hypothetical protein
MPKTTISSCLFVFFLCFPLVSLSEEDNLGNSIQIYTRLHSYMGRPSWLLIIRDIDNGQNIPYLYDISRGDNFWMAFTFSRNYVITTSKLSFSPFRHNPYGNKVIHNFCNLESNGRVIRGQSMQVRINGDLTPDTRTYTCSVARYQDAKTFVVTPGAN